MSDDNLEELLHELRDTLAEAHGLADEDRLRLTGILSEIEDAVEDEHHGVIEQIEDAVHRFEVEHVGLVGVLNRIANTLNASGI